MSVLLFVDDINADTGFEEAVAKAFGDTLLGTTDENGSMIWRSADPSSLPVISAPTSPFRKVKAMAVLTPCHFLYRICTG